MDSVDVVTPLAFALRLLGATCPRTQHQRLTATRSAWPWCKFVAILLVQAGILVEVVSNVNAYPPTTSQTLIHAVELLYVVQAVWSAVTMMSQGETLVQAVNTLAGVPRAAATAARLTALLRINVAFIILTSLVSFVSNLWIKGFPDVPMTLVGANLTFALDAFVSQVVSNQFLCIVYILGAAYGDLAGLVRRDLGRSVKGLRCLAAIDNTLKDVAQVVNDIHGVINLLSVAMSFAEITYGLTQILIFYNHLYSPSWLISHAVRITAMLLICSSSSTKVQTVTQSLLEVDIGTGDTAIENEVELVLLQLLHRKLEYHACGYFRLDFSLLLAILGVIATFLIVLIQMQAGKSASCSSPCLLPATNSSSIVTAY